MEDNKLRIIIELDSEGKFGIETNGLPVFTAVGMLELAKRIIFNGEDEEVLDEEELEGEE